MRSLSYYSGCLDCCNKLIQEYEAMPVGCDLIENKENGLMYVKITYL